MSAKGGNSRDTPARPAPPTYPNNGAAHLRTSSDQSSNGYLRRPEVMKFMDDVVAELIRAQPSDPEQHIFEFLGAKRSAGGAPFSANMLADRPAPPTQRATAVGTTQVATSPDVLQSSVPPRQEDAILEWAVTVADRITSFVEGNAGEPFSLPAPPQASSGRWADPLEGRLYTALKEAANGLIASSKIRQPATDAEVLSRALHEAAEASLGDLDEADAIERIVAASRRLLGADRCSVFIADIAKRELHTIIEGTKFYLAFGEGIAGTVAHTGRSLLITDAYEDPRFDSKVDQTLGYVTRDILCMPVRLHDRLVAVVQLVNKVHGSFTTADESLFASFAKFAAIRIINSQLFRDQQRLTLRNRMMADVAESLANAGLDESVLIPIIIKHAKAVCGADRCAYYQVNEGRQELTAHLEGVDEQITLPMSKGIAGWCATHRRLLNITDAYSDARFNKQVDQTSGYHTVNILCIPILVDRKIVAVSQLVNKIQDSHRTAAEAFASSKNAGDGRTIVPFTKEDEEALSAFAAICGVCIRNCRLVESVSKRQAVLESTLGVARTMLSSDVTRPQEVMLTITESACRLSNASRGILYMMDHEFTTLCAPSPDDPSQSIVIPVGEGVVGAAAAANTLQFRDGNGPADTTSFGNCEAHTTIACPIAVDGCVLGVVALANKQNCMSFSQEDVELVELFTVFAACVIRNARLFALAQQESEDYASLMAIGRTKTDATLDLASPCPTPGGSTATTAGNSTWDALLGFAKEESDASTSPCDSSRHGRNPMLPHGLKSSGATPAASESARKDAFAIPASVIEKYLAMQVPANIVAKLESHDFNIHRFRDGFEDAELLVPMLLLMFRRLDLVSTCALSERQLLRFLLAIRTRYRNIPYHSFFHAFDVTQTMFTLLIRSGLDKTLAPNELLAAMIAAVVHDVDHRGVNNNFHIKAETPMGILTSLTGQKAVLEVHHATIAVELLSSLNLFKGMAQEARTEAYRLIIDAVLATDMAAHKDFCEQFQLLSGAPSDSGDAQHRRLLVILLLKAADISNITKEFDVSRKWGISVMDEFYQQGDLERRSGVEVTPMFDREKRIELARAQLGFIEAMGRPFFLIVSKCLARLSFLVEGIDRNIAQWNRVLQNRKASI